MLNFRAIGQYFLSSLVGLVVLFALVKPGYERMAPAWAEVLYSAQAFTAEQQPRSEAINTWSFALVGAAGSEDSGRFYFLKLKPLTLRSLHTGLLVVKANRNCNPLSQSFSFFKILPNAP